MKKTILNINHNWELQDIFKIGMRKDEIRNLLNLNLIDFDEIENKDYLYDACYQIEYDTDNLVSSIEISKDYNKYVYFNNLNLFKLSAMDIIDTFKNYDLDVEVENDGIISYKYNIGFYFPFIKESKKSKPESIIFFKKGYYD